MDGQTDKWVDSRPIFSGTFVGGLYLWWSNGLTLFEDRNDMFVYQISEILSSGLSSQRSRGPYGGSNFQNGNFIILIADSESLHKSMNANYKSFFDIFMRKWQKLRLKVKIALLFEF